MASPELPPVHSTRAVTDSGGLVRRPVVELIQALVDGRPDRMGGITAFILTFCRERELFYGTSLIFRTLRTAFPHATVVVIDNGSIPEVRPEIESLAQENDCMFAQIPAPGVAHHEFIEDVVRAMAADGRASGPVVFLDPDLCFWASCEDFEFAGLLAGKLIRPFVWRPERILDMPRIHTSFMWIPDAVRLWGTITEIRSEDSDFRPFMPYSVKIAGRWCRYDTGASLYAVLGHRVSPFTEEHLNRYDHIFCGCHVDWISPQADAGWRELLTTTHARARDGDLDGLRGIWKWQDKVFEQLDCARTWKGEG